MLFGSIQMTQINDKGGKVYKKTIQTLREFFLDYYWNFKIKEFDTKSQKTWQQVKFIQKRSINK